jgi:hypothetical protein
MRTFSLIAVLLAVVASPGRLAAQPAAAGVVTTLVGQVTVARAAAPAPVALKFKDSVFLRDRIETRQDSVVRVLLGGRALVTVRELSVFTVTEEPGRARIDLSEGKLAVGVAKSLLRPGEAIEIRTPNAVAAVRGSELVAEVTRAAGVPHTTFTALEISLPITVTPLGAPGATVNLGINQAVSLTGLANALTITPVRNLTPAQAQDAARTGQAPKPKEQSERPPERVAQKVSEEKTREAAQLSETLVGAGGVGERAVSSTVNAELTGFKVADIRTSDLFIATSTALDEVNEVTEQALKEAEAAEPAFNPQFALIDQQVQAGAQETVKTYSGTVRETFSPVIDVFGSTVVQSGHGTFFKLEPGANVTIPGFFSYTQDSTIRTGGNILTVGDGATLNVGLGLFGLLHFVTSTTVTGAETVAIGAGAQVTTERSLIRGDGATFVAGADVDGAPFVGIGEGARVRTGILPFIVVDGLRDEVTNEVLTRSSISTTGALLSVGAGASLTTGQGLFGVVTLDATDVVAGAEVVAIEPRARVDLHQGLVSGVDSVFIAGASRTAPFVRIGANAQVTSDTVTPFLLVGGGGIVASGSVLEIEEGGSLVSTGASTFPFLAFTGTEVSAGGDVMSFATGSRLALDRPFGIFNASTIDVGGSVLGVAAGATISVPESLTIAALIFSNSLVRTAADVIRLEPGAAFALNRPLIFADLSGILSTGGSFLGLGGGAQLASSEVTTIDLVHVKDSVVIAAVDLVHLGPNARLDLVRPLLFGERSSLGADGRGVFLDDGARLVSSGQAFAAITLSETDVTTGDALALVHLGARVDLGRSLLSTFEGTLTLGRGLLTVAPGGQVVVTGTTDPLFVIAGGNHGVATEPGSAMFNLAGSATALDVESGLVVGTDRPVQLAGSLLGLVDGTITTQQAVRLDTALLEASRPLLQVVRSTLNVATDAVDLSLRSKVTALGPFLALDAGTISVLAGALVNVAGGSFLKVVGDFLDLRNGSAVNLLNGPLLSVSGGSAVNITGGLVNFGGTGGNQVNVANNLCPCTTVSGLPVAFQNGATPANVSIGPNPIRNGNLGTLGLASPTAAAIVVSGPTSRVTIGAP